MSKCLNNNIIKYLKKKKTNMDDDRVFNITSNDVNNFLKI